MLQLIQKINLSTTLTEFKGTADAKFGFYPLDREAHLFFHQKERSSQDRVKFVPPYSLGIGFRTPLDTKILKSLYKRGSTVGPPYPRVHVMQTELHLDDICISISYLQYSEL